MSRTMVVLAVLTAMNAWAETALFTGRSRFITTATYKQGIECEYRYLGRAFWRTFIGGSCPASVEVE